MTIKYFFDFFGWPGVSHTREGKYRAVLYVERKQIYLGVFNDEVSAARAHDKGVLAHGLGDAYLNFKVLIIR